MAYSCFWVQGDCIRPSEFTCRGCPQYPYGEDQVAPPGAPADFAQQLMGVHIGLAEVLAKKGIAKPEELDEAIARTIERLANQDRMLREAVCAVDGVVDSMIRVTEPGKLDVYVALEDEQEEEQQAIADEVIKALDGMVPPGTEIRVMVAPTKQEAAADGRSQADEGRTETAAPAGEDGKKPSAKKPSAKKTGKKDN